MSDENADRALLVDNGEPEQHAEAAAPTDDAPTATEDAVPPTEEHQVGETESGEAIMGKDRSDGEGGGGGELDFAAAGDNGVEATAAEAAAEAAVEAADAEQPASQGDTAAPTAAEQEQPQEEAAAAVDEEALFQAKVVKIQSVGRRRIAQQRVKERHERHAAVKAEERARREAPIEMPVDDLEVAHAAAACDVQNEANALRHPPHPFRLADPSKFQVTDEGEVAGGMQRVYQRMLQSRTWW